MPPGCPGSRQPFSLVLRGRRGLCPRVVCRSAFICLVLGLVSAGVEAQLINTVDYSDTFTVAEQGGVPERADGSFNQGPPAYDVEDSHGNPTSTWTPYNHFSFNTGLGSTCCGYPTNDGNAGASSGVAQSGGEDFSFSYGLRTNYTVQLDGILPPDRLDIISVPAAGDSIFTANSLSVFLRKSPGNIGLFNGVAESPILVDGSPLQTGITDSNWHNYAVNFNQDAGTIAIFVDGARLAEVDLATFQGGAYLNYSNGAVGAGGTFVLWADNFQVGEPGTPPTAACFSADVSQGLAPLAVNFDASCSFLAAAAQSYSWTFGDGGSAAGSQVSHTYTVGGSYEVTLTVKDVNGGQDSTSRTFLVFESATSFSDDFQRADGPIDGWTVFSIPDSWNILSGQLATGPTNEERWIWAGDPPLVFPNKIVLEFDMSFLGAGTNPDVGRHAGAVFCGNKPTHRYDPTFTGYFVDWIDRAADHGLRFTRVDNGGLVEIVRGAAGSPVDPPLTWRVELTNTRIRVFGDDVLYIDENDSTYRGGFAGLWTWAGGQEVAFDNVALAQSTEPVTACFEVLGPSQPTAGLPISFSGACTENSTPGATTYSWSWGDGSPDGSGETPTHSYAAAGFYLVELTARDSIGNESKVSKTIGVFKRSTNFTDTFERPDGEVTGWTIYSPPENGWTNLNGTLVTGPTTRENWIWAGSPPCLFPSNATYTWDQSFLGTGTNPVVGRHAGFAFCASKPTYRYDPGFTGYFVDWIDRVDDRGLRFTRVDGGGLVEIVRGQATIPVPDEPPLIWRVEVEDDIIRLFGDDTMYFEVSDGTYRGGFAGFWTWEGGQEVAYDNFFVEGQPVSACFTSTPGLPSAGLPIAFDGLCSSSFDGAITAYAWDFGDGATSTNASPGHTFAAAGNFDVKLEVTDSTGKKDSLTRTIKVFEPLLPFADCFDRPAGPVDGWTIASGDWAITPEGSLEAATGGEAFIYAGDSILSSDFVSEVDWELLEGRIAGVGRHAAVHFYWNVPTTNRFAADSRGYAVFYIDRAGDRGLSLGRFDLGGGFVVLNPPGGTPSVPEPPATLGIRVAGSQITVLADGVEVIQVDDATYRDGYFGLWAYNENTVRFDNVRIGLTTLPECGGGPGAPRFVRGDTDADGKINLTDAVSVLNYLFVGGREPSCFDAADSDDNGQLQLTDAVRLLGWLFLGNAAPPAPSPSSGTYPQTDCGTDPETEPADPLGCAQFGPCQ